MRVILTGGGTGGHIYPALSIGRGLQERYPGVEILYVGTDRGLEADIVPKSGYKFKSVSVAGFKRSLSPKNIAVIWRAVKGYVQAANIIKSFKPTVVVGTGGYVCGPVVLAAARRGIPTLVHEQNAYPGVTNKILARFVSQVTVTFEDSVSYFPPRAVVKVTGLPVRPEFFQADRIKSLQTLGLDPGKFVILVFGGSRGARRINLAMVDVLKKYQGDQRLQILHVTGQAGHEEYLTALQQAGISLVKDGNITIIPYLYNMPDALAAADLAICRAGAATLAEITALGRPAILVPYPYAAENHQEFNARALSDREAAILIRDAELTGEILVRQIENLLADRGKLVRMTGQSKELGRPRALADILDCIAQLV